MLCGWLERGARAIDHPGNQVTPELVGAERRRARGRLERVEQPLRSRTVGGDQWRAERTYGYGSEDQQTDEATGAQKAAPPAPPRRASGRPHACGGSGRR